MLSYWMLWIKPIIKCVSCWVTYIHDRQIICVISGFLRGLNEICDLLRCYVAYISNVSPAIRDNISVPSARVKQSHKTALRLKIGSTGCPETSLKKAFNLRCIKSQKITNLSDRHVTTTSFQNNVWTTLMCRLPASYTCLQSKASDCSCFISDLS